MRSEGPGPYDPCPSDEVVKDATGVLPPPPPSFQLPTVYLQGEVQETMTENPSEPHFPFVVSEGPVFDSVKFRVETVSDRHTRVRPSSRRDSESKW